MHINISYIYISYSYSNGAKIKTIIDKSTSPKLVSTGSLDEMHCLSLVGEGMVVVKLKPTSIVNAMICLISSYYAFNADYPKGATGHSKNVFIFLEHILLSGVCGKTVFPMAVENFVLSMK